MKKEYTTRIRAKSKFYENIYVDKETRNSIKFYNMLVDLELQGKLKKWKTPNIIKKSNND